MKFYKYLIEKTTYSNSIVLTLELKGNKYILSKDDNDVFLKTKNGNEICDYLYKYINYDPSKIIKVVNKVGKISFVSDKKILKRRKEDR